MSKLEIEKETLVRMYKKMKIVRNLEEALLELHSKGLIRGPVHLCIGQEAVGVGACEALKEDDFVTSTHRGHAHYIGKGLDLKKIVAEIMGKKTGYCKGRAGHMLVADIEKGLVGGCGIVGGMVPIATGYALAFKMQGTKRVAVCFFGDGAANQGTFHESLNIASLWKLPIVYICENNQYGLTVPVTKHLSVSDVSMRAAAYGIPGVTIDGNDVLAVYETIREAVERARRGEGPSLIEAKTYRLLGFSTGDKGGYQPEEEIAKWKKKDPIKRYKEYLLKKGILSEEEITKLDIEAKKEVDDAVKYALESPYPEKEEAFKGIYVENGEESL